jgi:methyl-accepting chemotaxis protein
VQLSAMKRLGQLQDACAQRAGSALAIREVDGNVKSSYSIMAQALINRDIDNSKMQFKTFLDGAAKDMASVGGIVASDQQRQWADQFQGRYKKYLDMIDKKLFPVLAEREQADYADPGMTSRLENKIRNLEAELEQAQASAQEPLKNIVDSMVRENEAAHQEFDRIAAKSFRISMAICFWGMLASLAIVFGIIRMITVPVGKAVALARSIALGDLGSTIDVRQKDEIGDLAEAMKTMAANLEQISIATGTIAGGDLTVKVEPLSDLDALGYSLRGMVQRLSETIADIDAAAYNVAAGARQLNDTSQSMSHGAAVQASSLEEISSSMNEITAQIRNNAENASLASKLAGEAMALAEGGNGQMQLMLQSMKQINEESNNISKIIKVIDEIAFQTNLLALNAAVEAARAGRHGKGFAVVAEEVRNLAARSAKAARETAEMIEGSVRKVTEGAGMADKTAEALKKILGANNKMTDLVAEIAAASGEQAQGTAQITAGLAQVDQVTQQNTAYAEESAAAAQELSSQAALLQQRVANFIIEKAAEGPNQPEARGMLPEAGRGVGSWKGYAV